LQHSELHCKFTDQAGSGIDTSDMYFRAAELMSQPGIC